jgi:3-dehydroquinate synthase
MQQTIIEQQFQVSYRYPVIFTEGLFSPENTVLQELLSRENTSAKRMLIILDAGMTAHHPGLKSMIQNKFLQARVSNGTTIAEVPGGEVIKNDPEQVKKIISLVNTCGIDRHSYVVGIGGGAVLDAAGFAAAVAHRGIRHIRIPTTVLSQNDSGIGVKNGINYFGKKNFLGTFSPPYAVINDTTFLTTLDLRQWRSGTAEAIKVALIKDGTFFRWLEDHAGAIARRSMADMEYLIYRCAELHLQHISSGDPFETGSSRPLDFGHWSAHKLEQLSGFSLMHGEAVAIGIALDALYSQQTGMLSAEETHRVIAVLQSLGFSLFHPVVEDPALLDGIGEFREHLGGTLTVMMLRGIGRGENIHTMDPAIVASSIQALKQLSFAAVAPQSMTEPS